MAYYDALIAKWPTLTPGSNSAKLTEINAIMITGSIPTSLYITGDQLLNCINWAEFNVLTAQQQSNVLTLCCVPGRLLGGSANTALMIAGIVIAYFPLPGPTVAALTALSKAAVQPWWQANGYRGPISGQDLVDAGLQAGIPTTPLA